MAKAFAILLTLFCLVALQTSGVAIIFGLTTNAAVAGPGDK